MKYIPKIGLEMHCEISKTKTKLFSRARNTYSMSPNTCVYPVDMAFPGTLPVLNKECVRLSLMASMILHCQIPEYFLFERKNYYYPDLPKGYQITQETKPIPVGIYGYLDYECEGQIKRIRINNIHLEEDAASLDHYYNTSTINYNRAGIPLLELVTEPDFHSANEAVSFLETMRSIYQYSGISEGDTKKGQIRCDVNVSIMDENLEESDPSNWGTKIEIKNVNSFGGVRDAINYEIKRQIHLKETNEYDAMPQQTRRWDEEEAKTKYMRSKVDAVDYKYFVEPNIPKLKIDPKWLEEIKESIPKLPLERKQKYIEEYGLSSYDAEVLIKDKDISDYFEECIALKIDAKDAANWVTVTILGELNKNDEKITDFYLTPSMLKEIIDAKNKNSISSKQAKEIFQKVITEKKEPKQFMQKENTQISDEKELTEIISKIVSQNESQKNAYLNGKTNLFDYFVGQVMKETKGKANPVMTKEILLKELQK